MKDYKLPKKMKKRKELDALVDTVKLPRSSKSSGSVQELLGSDSSENDEFSFPPPGSKRKNGCCIWQSIAAQIGLFMVTAACLATCVGLVWVQWHIRQELDALKKQVSSVESTDKTSAQSAQMTKFQSQLAEVNASVTNVRTGQGSLQELTNAVIDIQNKLKSLETAHNTLLDSVSASKKLLDLPQQVKILSETLAEAGSDIKEIKNTPAFTDANIETRIAALENKVKDMNLNPSSSPDKLSQEVNFNESLSTGLQSLRQVIDQQSTRISVLEGFTKTLSENPKSDIDSARITELVTKLLEEKSTNLTSGDHGDSNFDEKPLAVSSVENGEFVAFKADMLDNLENINKTIDVLNAELDAIADRLDSHDRAFMNLTMAVGSIKNKGATQSLNSSDVAESVTTATITSAPPASDLPGDITGNKTRTVIKIEGILTREDLHQAFQNGWPVENGQLDVDALNSFGREVVNKNDLKQFDTDANGYYTEDEMANALGFQYNPR